MTLLGLGLAAPASAAPVADEGTVLAAGGPTAIEDSYIVVLKDVAVDAVPATARSLAARQSGGVVRTYQHAVTGFEAHLTARAARRLAADPAVASVTQNHTVTASDVQSPTPSWGLDRIDQRARPVDDSYTYPDGAPVVTAYIIDGGINLAHTDFAGRIRPGQDFVDGGDPEDCRGHGTHVAGTVGGTTYGVAKNVEIVPVRVLNCEGSGSVATVMAGIDWITADHRPGAPAVANMSINGTSRYTPEEDAVRRSIADGITFVVSAGNHDGTNACNNTPAAVPEVITVGAVGPDDTRPSFSNIGPCVDLFAPGVDIVSANIGGDTASRSWSGTSMSAPHVTGAAALILADHPTWTPAQVAAELVADATPDVITDAGAGSPNRLLYIDGSRPADDFSLTATPAAATVTAGSSVSTAIAVQGTPQQVTLSAGGLPTGATASFGSSTLTVSTTAATAPGTYRVLVVGVGTSATRPVRFTLTVTAASGCVGGNDADTSLSGSNPVELPVTITGCGGTGAVNSTVEVHVDHTYIDDLEVDLVAPSGTRYNLLNRTGDDTDDIDYTFTHDLSAEPADGVWKLRVHDNAPGGTGNFDSWTLNLAGQDLPVPACGGVATGDFPFEDMTSNESPLLVTGCGRAASAAAYVEVRIVHPNERDLGVHLIAPDGQRITLQLMHAYYKPDIFRTYVVNLSGKQADGEWKLMAEDLSWGSDPGYIDSWKLTL
ncbi:S8 family serine peptidase [Catenuloplanes japonicus]|uniref:S8 family serine peptidase n=1 Tax=Catenuloplanes japonicus TaxID=33876 RepID=UPI000A7D4D1B|nr:S8 family serine peptidase [Catenuloplanes japonicus]